MKIHEPQSSVGSSPVIYRQMYSDALPCPPIHSRSPTKGDLMSLYFIRRSARRTALAATLATTLVAAVAAGPAMAAPGNPAGGTGPFEVLDPQAWQNPDTMTWNDWKPVPGKNWADPA